MKLGRPVGIGAGALSQDQIVKPDMLLQRTGGAHPQDVLHTEHIVKLMGIDADGGHPHAGGHDAPVGPGIALNAPDVVHQNGVLQEGLGNELRTQGIPGHQNGFAEITGFGVDVWGRIFHHKSLLCCSFRLKPHGFG